MKKINLEQIFMEYSFNMDKPELLKHKEDILNIMKEVSKQSWDIAVDKCKYVIDNYGDFGEGIKDNIIGVVKEMSKSYIK